MLTEENKVNRSFMKGAMILIVANALVKIIGAIFKIPLTYIIGEEGMGYFSTAYQMYTWLFIVATAGIPVAISKMVSESIAKQHSYEVRHILSVSMKLLMCIGVAGFVILFFGADFFANRLLKNPGAAYGIKAIAPAMFFVSLMSAYRGYFQGHQNMLPTAASEVTEAVGKLVIGFGAAYFLAQNGMELASAGAVLGVSCGGVLGFIVLFTIYHRQKEKVTPDMIGENKTRDSVILKNLVKIAVPITIGASVFSLTSLIDMAMIMRCLQSGGIAESAANKLWGSYSGYAFPMFNLPPTIINSITVSIVPAIASAFAVGNIKEASHVTCKSMKLTVLFALPCSVGMSVLSEPILMLVYKNANATSTLSILSCAIIFVSLTLVTNAILQATGNVMVPVRNMAIGGIAKILINYYLVSHPSININGAPIGTTVCYIIILVLNLVSMKRRMKVKFPVSELAVKPLIASAALFLAVYAVRGVFAPFGRVIACAAPVAVGAIVYLVVLVLIRAINEEDIRLLPKADRLVGVCRKFKIIR